MEKLLFQASKPRKTTKNDFNIVQKSRNPKKWKFRNHLNLDSFEIGKNWNHLNLDSLGSIFFKTI